METPLSDVDVDQYLTFTMLGEEYAIDVRHAREVIEIASITRIPKTPEFVRGVINLRGAVVPVVDLGLKFGAGVTGAGRRMYVVICEAQHHGHAVVIGVLADTVRQVIELPPGNIEPPPEFGTKVNVEYLKGMAHLNDRFVLLLDVDRSTTIDEAVQLSELAASVAAAKEPATAGAAGAPAVTAQ